MNLFRRIFVPEAGALRPRLACEITDSGVVAARPGEESGEIHSAYAPLPAGAITAGLKTPNFGDRQAVVHAIRQALDQIRVRENHVTAVIPDAALRVLLLDFDSLPSKASEALPIVRFRLRKLVPFEVEDASVSYQVMAGGSGLVRTVVAVSPGAVVAEYESAFREAGYEPGAILPSTIAALAVVTEDEPALLVHRDRVSVTTAITRQNELLLHRILELNADRNETAEGKEWSRTERFAGGMTAIGVEELRQSVSVAVAYFEDTLSTSPKQLLSSGPGGAEELARLLGDSAIPTRDLVPASITGSATSMPRGILAGVVGALAG